MQLNSVSYVLIFVMFSTFRPLVLIPSLVLMWLLNLTQSGFLWRRFGHGQISSQYTLLYFHLPQVGHCNLHLQASGRFLYTTWLNCLYTIKLYMNTFETYRKNAFSKFSGTHLRHFSDLWNCLKGTWSDDASQVTPTEIGEEKRKQSQQFSQWFMVC